LSGGRPYELPPLFVKTYDFVAWLLAATAKFPANYRTSLTSQIENRALRLMLLIGHAVAGRKRTQRLDECDELVEELRLLIRLAFQLKALHGARRYGSGGGHIFDF